MSDYKQYIDQDGLVKLSGLIKSDIKKEVAKKQNVLLFNEAIPETQDLQKLSNINSNGLYYKIPDNVGCIYKTIANLAPASWNGVTLSSSERKEAKKDACFLVVTLSGNANMKCYFVKGKEGNEYGSYYFYLTNTATDYQNTTYYVEFDKISGVKVSAGYANIPQVTPNPTLSGSEESLTAIKIGNTAYKIDSGSGGGESGEISLESLPYFYVSYNPDTGADELELDNLTIAELSDSGFCWFENIRNEIDQCYLAFYVYDSTEGNISITLNDYLDQSIVTATVENSDFTDVVYNRDIILHSLNPLNSAPIINFGIDQETGNPALYWEQGGLESLSKNYPTFGYLSNSILKKTYPCYITYNVEEEAEWIDIYLVGYDSDQTSPYLTADVDPDTGEFSNISDDWSGMTPKYNPLFRLPYITLVEESGDYSLTFAADLNTLDNSGTFDSDNPYGIIVIPDYGAYLCSFGLYKDSTPWTLEIWLLDGLSSTSPFVVADVSSDSNYTITNIDVDMSQIEGGSPSPTPANQIFLNIKADDSNYYYIDFESSTNLANMLQEYGSGEVIPVTFNLIHAYSQDVTAAVGSGYIELEYSSETYSAVVYTPWGSQLSTAISEITPEQGPSKYWYYLTLDTFKGLWPLINPLYIIDYWKNNHAFSAQIEINDVEGSTLTNYLSDLPTNFTAYVDLVQISNGTRITDVADISSSTHYSGRIILYAYQTQPE